MINVCNVDANLFYFMIKIIVDIFIVIDVFPFFTHNVHIIIYTKYIFMSDLKLLVKTKSFMEPGTLFIILMSFFIFS